MVPAGFQLPVYAFFLAAITLAIWRGRAVSAICSFAAGGLVGLFNLYVLYSTHGVWSDFLATIGRHSVLHAVPVQHSPWNDISAKWSALPSAFVVDLPGLAIAIVTVLVVWVRWAAVPQPIRRMFILASVVAFGLPPTIQLLYTYRIYYGWMTTIPLLVVLLAARDALMNTRSARVIAIAVAVVIVTGLPLRLALTALEWNVRNYRPVIDLVERNATAPDWVFTEFQAYYPVKRIAAATFLPPYARIISDAERARVTLLILGPESEVDKSLFPGRWRAVDAYTAASTPSVATRRSFGARRYELVVYRKQ